MQYWHSLYTALQLALTSLRAHKLRTFLTLLGVIIGVGSVVIVGSAVDGLGNYAESTTAKVFGSDSFQIGQLLQLGRLSRREVLERLRVNRRIGADEYAYLKQTTGRDILYSTYRQRADDIRGEGGTLEGAGIIGAAAALSEIREVVLTEGRFFTEREEQGRASVAVIGDEVRTKLFAGVSPVGRSVKIAGFDFRVVGVQEKIGSLSPGQSQDAVAFIPATTFNRLYGPERSMFVFARARPESGLSIDAAVDVTRVALRTRFKTKPGAADNFDTATPDAIKELIGRITGIIGAAVVPLTAISLVVGGIVIMNIMLVSVTERTREIGLRKSLGARQRDLLMQFLLEAVILAILGGAIGLAGATLVVKAGAAVSGIQLRVTPGYVLLALVVSTVTGVLSGWYPARRAARMDPVEALRAE